MIKAKRDCTQTKANGIVVPAVLVVQACSMIGLKQSLFHKPGNNGLCSAPSTRRQLDLSEICKTMAVSCAVPTTILTFVQHNTASEQCGLTITADQTAHAKA